MQNETDERNIETVAKMLLPDPECGNDMTVMCFKDGTSGESCLSVTFRSPGIFRSRPALMAMVDAAINAIWEDAYHSLFGHEAVPFISCRALEEGATRE